MATSQEPASKPATARRCVLIVEDNALNMKLFTAMISAQGYEVLQAGSGSRALDLAHQRHPALIIMDLQLPDMSGLDVTQALKTDDDTHEIPIIATTAYSLRSDEATIFASGCDAYMAKPIAISEFLELVETLMLQSALADVVA
jgi:two-component system, cell cycle response regulator DivK